MYNGKVVKALLLAKGKKGAELSQHLYGTPRRTLTPITNPGANPGVNLLEQIAAFFEVSTDVFFTPTDEVPDIKEILTKHAVPSAEKLEQYNNVDELLRAKDEQIHLLEERVKALESRNETYRKEKELASKK